MFLGPSAKNSRHCSQAEGTMVFLFKGSTSESLSAPKESEGEKTEGGLEKSTCSQKQPVRVLALVI